MNRILKHILCTIVILFFYFSLCSQVLAKDINTTLNIIQKSSENKQLENNQGFIEKSIVDSNSNNGEVTIEVKLSNSKGSSSQTTIKKEAYEIFLVIDDSGSMGDTISNGGTREEAVYNASKQLVENILKNYNNVKIGVIKFGGGWIDSESDAEKMCDLSSDKDTIIKAIEAESSVGGSTNLEAGLILANKSFSSSNANKTIIVLTDGGPNGKITAEDENGKSLSVEEATKYRLIELDKSKINIISLLTEIEDESTAEAVFGTPEKPTVGKYYYIADSDIQKVINENIYADVSQIISNPTISNIKIVDYFPSDIIDNFEFSYVGEPKLGTVSKNGIDLNTKSITWEIDELKGDEEATLQYKIKLKDMENMNLLDKEIATNEKVVLTYKDFDSKDYTVNLTSSPKIKLSKVNDKSDNKNNNVTDNNTGVNSKRDNTVSGTNRLPNTGMNYTVFIVMLVIIVVSIITYRKYRSYRDIK